MAATGGAWSRFQASDTRRRRRRRRIRWGEVCVVGLSGLWSWFYVVEHHGLLRAALHCVLDQDFYFIFLPSALSLTSLFRRSNDHLWSLTHSILVLHSFFLLFLSFFFNFILSSHGLIPVLVTGFHFGRLLSCLREKRSDLLPRSSCTTHRVLFEIPQLISSPYTRWSCLTLNGPRYR